MKPGSKLPIALVAAIAVAIVAVVLLRGGADDLPAPAGGGTPTEGREAREVAADLRTAATGDGTAGSNAIRNEVPTVTAGRGYAQGFRGRVVDEFRNPVQGATVYLVEGSRQQDVFTALLMAQKGVVVPPVAKAETDPRGRFEVGVRTVSPSGYDIHIVSDRHAGQTVPKLTLFEGQFIDLSDITLPRGLTLSGQVTVQGGNGFPVPDARVTVRSANILPTFGTAPGHEDGVEVRADAAGQYRVDNIAAGFVTVTAVAPGFARVERQSVEIRPDVENRVDFELPKGRSISGVVVGDSGLPVAGARVDAMLISATAPTLASAHTDADGRFDVLGLVDGPYHLAVVANGFVTEERKPVRAGAGEERFVLRRQATIAVRANGRSGPLPRCEALLRAYHAEHDTIGHVPTAQLQQVLPGDLVDGWFRIPDVNPGTYVVQIDADGYARTFSAPFTVALDAAEPRIEVAMSDGGMLTGRVVGPDGQAIEGARLDTLPDFLDDGPFAEMVGEMVPHRITRTSIRTGKNGRFELPRLAAGTYQLRFDDPAFSTRRMKGITITEGETVALGDIVLARGAEIHGTVTLDGAPAGQVKVSVSSRPDPNNPTAPIFRAEAVTADDGTYTMPRRLPPGDYEARAARQTLPNPILQVVDYQNTRTEFTISPGQLRHQLHFTMKSD